MTVLVVGATGATGRLLVRALLDRGHKVKAVARSPDRIPEDLRHHEALSIVHAELLDLTQDELVELVRGCTAIASCLGHTLSLKGIYGAPRRLVTDATRRLCEAVEATRPTTPVRFVLMNTAGNGGRRLGEQISFGQRFVVGLVRLMVPPHADNEEAADHLRIQVGTTDPCVEWVVVRPDSLIDTPEVTAYEVVPSPTRSAIFDPGKTRRIHVAHFMAMLSTDDATWQEWKGRMPVLYDEGFVQHGRPKR